MMCTSSTTGRRKGCFSTSPALGRLIRLLCKSQLHRLLTSSRAKRGQPMENQVKTIKFPWNFEENRGKTHVFGLKTGSPSSCEPCEGRGAAVMPAIFTRRHAKFAASC